MAAKKSVTNPPIDAAPMAEEVVVVEPAIEVFPEITSVEAEEE